MFPKLRFLFLHHFSLILLCQNSVNFGELQDKPVPSVEFFSLQAMSQTQEETQEYSSSEMIPSGNSRPHGHCNCISSSEFKGPIPTVPNAHQPPAVPKDRVDVVPCPSTSTELPSHPILPCPPPPPDSSVIPQVLRAYFVFILN